MDKNDPQNNRFHGVLKVTNEAGIHRFINLCGCHPTKRVLIDPSSQNLIPEIQAALDVMSMVVDNHENTFNAKAENIRLQVENNHLKHSDHIKELHDKVDTHVESIKSRIEEVHDSHCSHKEHFDNHRSDVASEISDLRSHVQLLYREIEVQKQRGVIPWLKRLFRR